MAEVGLFAEAGDAETVAAFLRTKGIPARVPPVSQLRGPGGSYYGPRVRGRVIVSDADEAAALALFDRVRRGEFRHDPACAAINRHVLGAGFDAPDWKPGKAKVSALPIWIVMGLIVAGLAGRWIYGWITGAPSL